MNVHSVSIKGKREQNEDKHKIILNGTNKNNNIKDVNMFCVFDGHGGKDISKYMYDNIEPYFMGKNVEYPLRKKYIIDVLDKLQTNLRKYDKAYRAGTTSLIAINFKYNGSNYINIINSGDSRCVLCRDNFAMPLTKDHKPHWPEERRRIEKLGGKIVFDGYDWRIRDLSVSRAFGDLDSNPYVTHRPDIFRYKLDKNDKFVVLACDGLWDVLSNDDVVNFVLDVCYDDTFTTRINKNINVAKKLSDYALKKGSTDNITIIVVFLN